MKTWTFPTAIAQQFAANDYVSACYDIKCTTPRNNASYNLIVADSNGNGVYDEGVDTIIHNPADNGKTYTKGCGGTHSVTIIGAIPTVSNGFAVRIDKGVADPIFYWDGSVINTDEPGNNLFISDLHVTDLNTPGLITESSNKS